MCDRDRRDGVLSAHGQVFCLRPWLAQDHLVHLCEGSIRRHRCSEDAHGGQHMFDEESLVTSATMTEPLASFLPPRFVIPGGSEAISGIGLSNDCHRVRILKYSAMSSKSYKVIGTPFSTFTRTITLGLHYKSLPFEQVTALPQSDIARQSHPYGYLPTLIITDSASGRETKLCESQAIARYIDRIAPEPLLHLDASTHTEVLPEKVWEVASLVASFGGCIGPWYMRA